MRSGSSCLPGPAHVLLLLLLLLPLLSMGNFQYRLPGWLDFHHLSEGWRNLHQHFNLNKGSLHHRRSHADWPQETQTEEKSSCQSAYDIYFVLDMSGSVDNNWMDIYHLVNDLVKKFENPKVRISFILYSTLGQTVMKLTSDKKKIVEGLHKLRNVVPTGATNMQEGLKKANYQILEATNGDGTLEPIPLEEAKDEAAKARKMGATVYGLGVKDYRKDQLVAIADSKEHVLGVNRFQDLKNLVNPITEKTCIEVTRVEASSYCVGENYELLITGKGFNNAGKKEDVVCRFKFTDTEFFDKKATSVDDSTIMCPGVKIEKPDQQVFVQISLDNGASFIDNNANITSKDCAVPQYDFPESRSSVGLQDATDRSQVNDSSTSDSDSSNSHKENIPLYVAIGVAALFFILFLIFCLRKCCKKTVKEAVPIPVPCVQRPIVVVPCCGCRNDRIKQMEGKLDSLYHFPRGCNQVPLMWYQPRNKGRCLLNPFKTTCAPLPCCQNLCLQPNEELLPLTSCCSRCQPSSPICSTPSRMLPLFSPPARILCGTPLSLPPP
ncbi:anthrax toxin receptor-like isoform X2 [Erinaceus europaeus]|uniref:Anthrax toxin receptor-like isoform X2 n=1 Tax=Erinaceus europaeus TaxID=9365 RepID=A0ABM3XE38_ERIEU|nr:anthrax toxin receptor-like isoform X2 [Erinaceus europaeus]